MSDAPPVETVALREVGGEAVTLDIQRWGEANGRAVWSFGVADSLLGAGLRYEVVADGEVVSTFEVGSEQDTVPPAFGGVQEVIARRYLTSDQSCANSCFTYSGRFELLRLVLDGTDELVLAVAEVRRDGEAEPFFAAPIDLGDTSDLASLSCSTARPPLLEPGVTYCVRVTGYDGAGNATGGGEEVCVSPDDCHLGSECVELDRDRCDPLPDGTGDDPPASGGCRAAPAATPTAPLFALAALLALAWKRRTPATPASSR